MMNQIGDLVKDVLNDLEDNQGSVENPEAVLERIRVGLSIGYKSHPELLDLIDDSLKGEIDQAVFLANHFLKYGGDIREIDLSQGLDYVKKIRNCFLDNDSTNFSEKENRFGLFHLDFMIELDKKNAQKKLEEKGGLERYILELSGVDAGCMGEMEFDHFESVFDYLSKEINSNYKFDNIFHSRSEIDTGQVTAVPGESESLILDDENVKRVIEVFKCIEVIKIKDRYNDDDCYRETCQMDEHTMRAFCGPFDKDEEEYWFGEIDKSGRPELVKRYLCHTMVLEGKEKKLYQEYMNYQNKRFEGIRKYHERQMVENSMAEVMYGELVDEDEESIDKYVQEQFEWKRKFWLTILNTSINCLLDQGYKMPKIIEVVETNLNPFKNESEDIIENLKPILERRYKD